jgi:SAM-dependent methyltransferase
MVMDTDAKLDAMGFFQPDFFILDIGCGVGYIPLYLRINRKPVKYLGIDVSRGRIQHCRALFPGTQFQFKVIDIHSETYNSMGRMRAEEFKIPLGDNSVDSIICHSLFTHLDTEIIAKRYIDEIKRVLKVGGFLWTTWFPSPPNGESDGTRRTVYPLAFIHDQLADLEPIYLHGGESTGYHDQLEIACVKA